MNAKKLATGILFVVAGLVFAGLGIWVQFFRNSGYVRTQAEIIKIEKTSSSHYTGKGKSGANYVAYVEYEVDGKIYAGPSDIWKSGMRTGQVVTIYYNPDNPAQMGGDAGWLGWFVIGIGGFTALAGGAMMLPGKAN